MSARGPRRRRHQPKFVVPVASMGDIAFLLIIFFVLCSTFARESGIKVVPPTSRDIEQIEKSQLAVTVDAEHQIYFQGNRVFNADALETDVADKLRKAVSDAGRRVVLRCDKDVDRAVFEPVMDAITRAGGIVVAVGEKKKRKR